MGERIKVKLKKLGTHIPFINQVITHILLYYIFIFFIKIKVNLKYEIIHMIILQLQTELRFAVAP